MNTKLALQRFGFRQGLKGALIIGFLVGFMVFIQAYGYKETYPDKASQDQFAQSLSAAPSLGILYGSTDNLSEGANGYIVYRVVAFMSLIIAVWAIMAITKLLRGNEEDGRWEVIRSGGVTATSSTLHVTLGFLYAFLLSFIIGTCLTVLTTSNSDFNMPLHSAVLIGCALFAPALLFVGVGVFVSQLAITRRRALFYGLFPLVITYFIRSIANTNPDFKALLEWTPFGWSMLISPVVSPQALWLLPYIFLFIVFTIGGIWLAHRDLGSSVIRESKKVKSHFFLLGSPWQLALRQNIWTYVAWGGFSLSMGGIVASILNVATDATASSSTLSKSVSALASNTSDLKLAFLGAGMIFVVLVLLILATVIMGSIRGDEAKQYLETILVHPKTRTMWLIGRLVLGIVMTLLISFASVTLVYFAAPDDLDLDFLKLTAFSISMLGTVIFLMGAGTLMYGVLPRITVISMYLIICWSFIIDLVSSVIKLDEIILQSSLFHYMTFNLADWPDWKTFAWLTILGIIMAAIGIVRFTKRDLTSE